MNEMMYCVRELEKQQGRNKRPFYSKNEGSCLSMFLPEINELP
jgi:hypothetical protein